MLISHRNRFIYTKTMKTAGTSVEIYFEDACLPARNNFVRGHAIDEIVTPEGIVGHRGGEVGKKWYNHMPAALIKQQVGDNVWGRYFKFCVIRNPFDKLVSYWWFILTPEERNTYKQQNFTEIRSHFSKWAIAAASALVDRNTYQIDGNVCVDFFIRYEKLLDGLEYVCRQVDYPFQPKRLGRYKSDTRAIGEPFRYYFDEAATFAVKSVFGWELEYFGYDLA
jgi:hypothetical protein